VLASRMRSLPPLTGVLLVTLPVVLAGLALLAGAVAGTTSAAAQEGSGGVAVTGTLRDAGEPLAGVEVEAVDSTGAVAGSATSEESGRWSIELEPGDYVFRIVEDSLPEGVTVQGEVSRTVAASGVNVVIFTFGEERTGLQTGQAERLLRLFVEGIRFGLVIAITAVGLSLIFGTTGLTNFAHGELVTVGAIFGLVADRTLADLAADGVVFDAVGAGVRLALATLVAIACGIAFGILNDLAIWAPLRRRRTGLVAQMIATIGLALAVRYVILMFFGGRSESFPDYRVTGQRDLGLFEITDINLVTIAVGAIVLVLVALLLQYTRIGKAMRAVSDNPALASASGIDVERVVRFVWGLGGGLAALGGVLFGLSELSGNVQFEMGFRLLLLMFAGIVLGGLGTAYGALVGALVVGILVQMSTIVVPPDLKYVGGLLVLIVILVVRPQGILGAKVRVG
jgi:neutral amino acid transport system permease protein